MESSRRKFLKIAGISALGFGTKPVLDAFAKAEQEGMLNPELKRGQDALTAKRWGMVIDTRKFQSEADLEPIIEACHKIHNVPTFENKRHEIKWIWTEEFNHCFPTVEQEFVNERVRHLPFLTLCNHCDQPACVRACPTKATFKREDGIVLMDFHRCIGCRFCMAACPYGSRSFNFRDPRPFIQERNDEFPTRTKGVVEKCNFCAERLAIGLAPACVEASNGAMAFGDLDDPESDVRKLLKEIIPSDANSPSAPDPISSTSYEVVMLEKALKGSKQYYGWLVALLAVMGAGFLVYLWQLSFGLGITGMSRDVSWGFYIAQFTFLVGVAASAVMVVLPYYLHDYKAFGRITILGEFLAVASVTMCILFIFVDLGQPMRVVNVLLYPTPNSVLFWDMIVLNGYLLLNIVIGWKVLESERNNVHYPVWLKPLIYLSIPWAVSIHTVTAFLYCGLPGRGYWLTAILAPRFLSSAFAAGPAFLILLCLIVRKVTKFDPGREQIMSLSKIVTYGICVNMFFFLCEVFVVFYSRIPEHMDHFKYLFTGLHGHGALVPWMWTSIFLQVISIILLVNPVTRKNEPVLAVACLTVFFGTWIDKGLGMISGGFVPNPLHHVAEYIPTPPEIMITIGVYATGFLVLTVLYKIAVTIKEELLA